MQSDRKNTSVLAAFYFVILLDFGHHRIPRREKNLSKTVLEILPNPSDTHFVFSCLLKRFRNGLGAILASQMGSSRRALRRPRGLQTPHDITLASLKASGIDFGLHVGLSELHFGLLLAPINPLQRTLLGASENPPAIIERHGGGSCEALEYSTIKGLPRDVVRRKQ